MPVSSCRARYQQRSFNILAVGELRPHCAPYSIPVRAPPQWPSQAKESELEKREEDLRAQQAQLEAERADWEQTQVRMARGLQGSAAELRWSTASNGLLARSKYAHGLWSAGLKIYPQGGGI